MAGEEGLYVVAKFLIQYISNKEDAQNNLQKGLDKV